MIYCFKFSLLFPKVVLKIGLTGGIGSGKTTVAKIFELLEIPVYYADEASKHLYHTNKQLMTALKSHFGEDIYTDEELNRSKRAAIVFNDPAKLQLRPESGLLT